LLLLLLLLLMVVGLLLWLLGCEWFVCSILCLYPLFVIFFSSVNWWCHNGSSNDGPTGTGFGCK
jgi:hypothetical protein